MNVGYLLIPKMILFFENFHRKYPIGQFGPFLQYATDLNKILRTGVTDFWFQNDINMIFPEMSFLDQI